MERVNIRIETSNAAFEEKPLYEVARILRRLADDLTTHGWEPGNLRDLNGNTVGYISIFDL